MQKGEYIMRIGASLSITADPSDKKRVGASDRRFSKGSYADVQTNTNDVWVKKGGNRMQEYDVEESGESRSEAEKIYQAAAAGKTSVEIRQTAKVPYGYLAKDGVITYKGVTFVCDERTNSICLGNMDDKKNVLNIPLSGGGHLKVHRDNLGELSKAIGMFSPEDVNRILRAIHQDTKIQSMQQELDEMENSVGESLQQEKAPEEEEVQ